MIESLKICISYAHKDRKLKDALGIHLKALQRVDSSIAWYERQIGAESAWEYEKNEHLETSDLLLLLITANFIASEGYSREIERAMARHTAGQARVIPIILSPAHWKPTGLGDLQVLPAGEDPACSGADGDGDDTAFLEITQGIQRAIDDFRSGVSTKRMRSEQLHESLLYLNYKQQGRVFDRFLKKGPAAGAFIIHGESEYGQDWLLNRFLHRLSQRLLDRVPRSQIGKVHKLNFACQVRKRDLSTIWRELAAEIGVRISGPVQAPEALIDTVLTALRTRSVVFILRNPVHIGEHALKQFLDGFWFPLVTRYAEDLASPVHYCLLFLIDNDNCIETWATVDAGPFDPPWAVSSLVVCHRLSAFDEDELTRWIDDQAEAWPDTPTPQEFLAGNQGVPERVLDQICLFFGFDWYERVRIWLKY